MQIELKVERKDAPARVGAGGAFHGEREVLERLLFFREEPAKPRRRPGAHSSQLARAAARIERSREVRRSLRRVLELVGALQAVLEPAQRARWLAFEDAFLDHNARLQ